MARSTNTGDLYASLDREGIRPATISRERTVQKEAVQRDASNKPMRSDHFTDAAGNVYRQHGDATQRYENGSWSRVTPSRESREKVPQPAKQDQVQQPRDGSITPRNEPQSRPVERDPRPEVAPREPSRRDPFEIQRDRQRGNERQRNFQRSSPPRVTPAPRSRQGGVSPAPAQRSSSPAPSRGGGGGSAPSRSGGSQRGGR